MILIKRYQNGKMYDTSESSYVSHKEILFMVLDEVEFQVIQNINKRVITNEILLELIALREKHIPTLTTHDLIIELKKNSLGAA